MSSERISEKRVAEPIPTADSRCKKWRIRPWEMGQRKRLLGEGALVRTLQKHAEAAFV